MKKLITIVLVAGLITCLFVGCTPTTPAEGEGEGEGEEEVTRVVLVEIFSQEGCAYCKIAEPILEELAEDYSRDEMILVEMRAYGLYSLNEIRDRYQWYFPSSDDRSTPNILFNGLNQRIHHQSTTYDFINAKIKLELKKDPKVLITLNRNSDSSTTSINGTIKNVSSSDLSNLVINGMIFKDLGKVGLKYTVTDILEEQKKTITALTPGGTYSFTFTIEGINWVANKFHGVIFVQDILSSKKEVLQAKYVD